MKTEKNKLPLESTLEKMIKPENKRYEIINNGEAIRCLSCGLTSYNHGDIQMKYCGNCRRFHDDDYG